MKRFPLSARLMMPGLFLLGLLGLENIEKLRRKREEGERAIKLVPGAAPTEKGSERPGQAATALLRLESAIPPSVKPADKAAVDDKTEPPSSSSSN